MGLVREVGRAFLKGFREGVAAPDAIVVIVAKEVSRHSTHTRCLHCGAIGTMEIVAMEADGQNYYHALPFTCCDDQREAMASSEGLLGNN